MYDIYERSINHPSAGHGIESLIVRDGVIVAHVRGWDNPQIVDTDFDAPLKGQPAYVRGQGWRKLRRADAEPLQGWAGKMAGE